MGKEQSRHLAGFAPQRRPLSEEPWRDFEEDIWTEQAYGEMIAVLKECFVGSEAVKYANIALMGPITSGKSAFVNSVLSIGSTSVLAPANSGQATHSYTTKLGVYENRCATIGNLRLFDTMGLEQDVNEGFNVNDVTLLLQGHIPKNYQFNPKSQIQTNDRAYKRYPKAVDKTHLVVFVISALDVTSASSIPKPLLRKVAELQERIKDLGIPRMLILTHVDKICPEVKKDIRKLYHSVAVEEAVERAGDLFNIPPAYIHPVQNYHKATRTNERTNVPLLLALRHMLDLSNDYFQRCRPGEDEWSWWDWNTWWQCNVL